MNNGTEKGSELKIILIMAHLTMTDFRLKSSNVSTDCYSPANKMQADFSSETYQKTYNDHDITHYDWLQVEVIERKYGHLEPGQRGDRQVQADPPVQAAWGGAAPLLPSEQVSIKKNRQTQSIKCLIYYIYLKIDTWPKFYNFIKVLEGSQILQILFKIFIYPLGRYCWFWWYFHHIIFAVSTSSPL